LLIENGLLVVFFMSGVFFPIEGQAVAVLGWNPLVGLFANYRAALIGTTEFDWSALSYAMSVGMGLLIVGVGLLIVLDRRFAKIVNG
jgi:ABC-type polysaccharide/polyol phosphate export permease